MRFGRAKKYGNGSRRETLNDVLKITVRRAVCFIVQASDCRFFSATGFMPVSAWPEEDAKIGVDIFRTVNFSGSLIFVQIF